MADVSVDACDVPVEPAVRGGGGAAPAGAPVLLHPQQEEDRHQHHSLKLSYRGLLLLY